MCEIDKSGEGISRKPGKPRKYPFDQMDVGDSFTVKGKNVQDISGSLNYANKTLYPANFKAGVYDDKGKRIMKDGIPAVRIVRMA